MDKRKSKLIKDLKKFKNSISKKYNPEKMIFFGSRASGKPHKDSDVDLIIVSKKFNKVRSLKRSPELYLEWHLNSDMDYPVDFICYTPEEFDKLKKQITMVKQAIEEGIEI